MCHHKISLLSCLKQETTSCLKQKVTRHQKQEVTSMTSEVMKMMKFVLLVVTMLEVTSACPSPPPTTTTSTTTTPLPPPCKIHGFHNTTAGCFHVVEKETTRNWHNADRLCQGLGNGVYLAVLDTQEVSRFLIYEIGTTDRTICVVP